MIEPVASTKPMALSMETESACVDDHVRSVDVPATVSYTHLTLPTIYSV